MRIAVICETHKQFDDWCKDNKTDYVFNKTYTHSAMKINNEYICIVRQGDSVGYTFNDFIELTSNYDLRNDIMSRIVK